MSLIDSWIAILHRGSDEIDEFCNNIVGKFIVCQAFAQCIQIKNPSQSSPFIRQSFSCMQIPFREVGFGDRQEAHS